MTTELITIADRQFTIPVKYSAGSRDLTTAEAGILQSTFRANLAAFLLSRIKRADELTDEQAAALQLDAEAYAAKHIFGTRTTRVGKEPPLSPIDTKALSLICDDIRAAIRKRDGKCTTPAEEIRDKAKLVIAGPKGQGYRSEARAFFKRREAAQLDMFEEPAAQAAE